MINEVLSQIDDIFDGPPPEDGFSVDFDCRLCSMPVKMSFSFLATEGGARDEVKRTHGLCPECASSPDIAFKVQLLRRLDTFLER